MKTKFYFLILTLLFVCKSLFAQYDKQALIAEQYLQDNQAKWALTDLDIADIVVEKAYKSKHNGVTHITFQQRYKGIPIYNAQFKANLLASGKVFYATNRFYTNLVEKVNSHQAAIAPEEAIAFAAKHLKISTIPDLKNKSIEGKTFTFTDTNISKSPLTVQLRYQPMSDEQIVLAWELMVDMVNTVDNWNIRIDAQTGQFLKKDNWTRKCAFPNHEHSEGCGFLEKTGARAITTPSAPNNTTESAGDGASYNVFAIPLESPFHGERTIVKEPADPVASPFGWHDTDGMEGPEYTYTRGNNVHAYADITGRDRTTGDEPEGTATLTFDAPFDINAEPLDNKDAAVNQIFYMSNIMHDFTYQYGFDEAAGNYQNNNYSNGGRSGDPVIAEALDRAQFIGDSTETLNNANFSLSGDGSSGRIQMYVWNQGGGKFVKIEEPIEVAADFEAENPAFGPTVIDAPVRGKVVVAMDNTASPTLGCLEFINPTEMAGNIALIDRGKCNFVDKVRNAQAAGAIATLVCNHEEALVRMGPPAGDNASDITIPSVFIRRGDCQEIRALIDDGLVLSLGQVELFGPDFVSGSFDNSVVAHEYAHGISGRLVGVSCLGSAERMDEGWSDFFALVLGVEAGDKGTDRRGVGIYAERQETNGSGVRRFPYSTDMDTNPTTYGDIVIQGVHETGAIWASALWDLYWAMTEEYGWNADVYNGTGGNNMAIQLVTDGLKMTACRPGFMDARDAILAADEVNYGGANQCLIWKVFARRGMGFSAEQASTQSRDAFEAFDEPPTCIPTLKIAKAVTDMINAGEEINVTLTIRNDTEEAVSGIFVTDELPLGTSYKAGTASMTPSENSGVDRMSFLIEELASGAIQTITYTLGTDASKVSIRQFFDGGEDGDDIWLYIDEDEETDRDTWSLNEATPRTGEYAWSIVSLPSENRQTLRMDEPFRVSGNFPTLRFYHDFETEPGFDAGLVEISTDDGFNWIDAAPFFLRNSYAGTMAYGTFAEANKNGFWGDSNGFMPSFIDLRSFIGEDIILRFRYGTDNGHPVIGTTTNGDPIYEEYDGWQIDDIEFIDLLSYNGEACLSIADSDGDICAVAPEGGTFVEVGQMSTAVDNLADKGLVFNVFPNPAGDYLNVRLRQETSDTGTLSLYNANGQQLQSQIVQLNTTSQLIPFNVSQLPGGFYFVEVRTAEGVAVKKVILE